MGTQRRELYFVVTVLAATLVGAAYFSHHRRVVSMRNAEANIQSWSRGPRAMAQIMIGRYGPPDVSAPDVATWYDREPWKRISVRDDPPDTYLEQAVGYIVPPEATALLRDFGHGLRFNLANDELSATSNSESLNIMALNLANELCESQRDPKEAGAYFVRTAELAAAGKSSPYMEKLMFVPYRRFALKPWNREIRY